MLGDQAVAQRRRMAVVVDQFAVEVALATVMVVIEDLVDIDQLGPLLRSEWKDYSIPDGCRL